jgi:hypothetical protein
LKFFCQGFDDMALLDQSHFYEGFTYTFRFGCGLELNFACRSYVVLGDEVPAQEDIADAESVPVAAHKIIQARFADKIKIEQDFANVFRAELFG